MRHLLCTLTLLLSFTAAFADVELRGTVTTTSGDPIVGAALKVVNTRYGAYSKSKGVFTIKIPAATDLKIVVQMFGYRTLEVDVASADISKPLTLKLVEDRLKLNEAVVIGYGTKQRQELTGSVAQVSSREIAQNTYGNFENAIVGRAPGVQVINSNGMAGSYEWLFTVVCNRYLRLSTGRLHARRTMCSHSWEVFRSSIHKVVLRTIQRYQ